MNRKQKIALHRLSQERTQSRALLSVLPPVIDKENTGKRIRHLMQRQGYTVHDLKDYLYLGCVQSIYHWLDGRTLPSLDNLYALSELFDVPMDKIVCGSRNRYERRGYEGGRNEIRRGKRGIGEIGGDEKRGRAEIGRDEISRSADANRRTGGAAAMGWRPVDVMISSGKPGEDGKEITIENDLFHSLEQRMYIYLQ